MKILQHLLLNFIIKASTFPLKLKTKGKLQVKQGSMV
jgi:hypothetical protein